MDEKIAEPIKFQDELIYKPIENGVKHYNWSTED